MMSFPRMIGRKKEEIKSNILKKFMRRVCIIDIRLSLKKLKDIHSRGAQKSYAEIVVQTDGEDFRCCCNEGSGDKNNIRDVKKLMEKIAGNETSIEMSKTSFERFLKNLCSPEINAKKFAKKIAENKET